MLILKYVGSEELHFVNFRKITDHIVEVTGDAATSSDASVEEMAENIKNISADIYYKEFTGTSFSTTASDLGASKIIGAYCSDASWASPSDGTGWGYKGSISCSYTDTTASGSASGKSQNNAVTEAVPSCTFVVIYLK